MSTVEVNRGRYYNMPVPVGTVPGSPVALGFITGHALNARDAAGNADVALPGDIEELLIPVTARVLIDPAGIALGARLFYDTVNNVVDNDGGVNHVPFGVAFQALAIVGGVDTVGTINVFKWTF